jgi:peptidase S46-like protein
MRIALALAAIAFAAPAAKADEGMWTFDAFPSAKVKQLYGFGPDQKWLDRVRKASVRLDGGCSGSVVSTDGLVLTNHHCVSDCATALSSPQHDLANDGYLAATRKDEKICPGAEASILQSITDVTDRVKRATTNTPAVQAGMARAAEIARIEAETCGEDRRKRCEVVNLYRGGQYKLYVYDRYDDLRIAFVPELQAAFFGGDPDNFNFPRYALDMALIRLYRDGEAVKFADPLRIDPAGAQEGELVFTSGHPGSTERLLTNAQLEFQRDYFLPWRTEYLSQIRGSLIAEGTKGEEEARQVNESLLSIENSLKVFRGQRGALVEPSFFSVKVAEEKKLRDALAADSKLKTKYGDPFGDIERAIAAQKLAWMPYQMLEARFGAGSVLLTDARTIVRAVTERPKSESQRLPEFSPSRFTSTQAGVLAEAPVHPVLEKVEIAFWLDKTREYLGPDNAAVKALFGSHTSQEIAADIVANSQIGDLAFRKKLWDNPGQVAASNDPAIALVRRVDAAARAARAKYEQNVTSPVSIAAEKVASLRFDVLGQSIYPDATFTLRLSYGTVKGWNDPMFGEVKPFTFVSGLWDRATGAFPFNLGAKWIGGKSKVPGTTQQNFVSTNDIIGGNSGSPVLNKDGRVVGLAFDGNIHSTGGAYGFDAALNRCVSVSSQLIVTALRNIYGATELADELERKS